LPEWINRKEPENRKKPLCDDAPNIELIPKGKEKDYNKSTEKKKMMP